MDLAAGGGHSGGMHAESDLNNKTAETKSAVGPLKRRRWAGAERRQIVEETLAPGASVARVALAHGVNANQVFTWRRQYQRGLLGPSSSAGLLPVKIADVPGAVTGRRSVAAEIRSAAGRASVPGIIEITLRKAQIRIEGDVDRDTLRVVLKSVLR